MRGKLGALLNRFERSAFERDVEEELRFHIDMRTRDFERDGLTPDQAAESALKGFGDFNSIKTQCVQIGLMSSSRAIAMRIVFTLAFVLGVLIRVSTSDTNFSRVGNILIAIAILGGLLLLGKSTGVPHSSANPIALGLRNSSPSIPIAFDENGRTPFERVSADD